MEWMFYVTKEIEFIRLVGKSNLDLFVDATNCPLKPKCDKYYSDFYILMDRNKKIRMLTNDNMDLDIFKSIIKKYKIIAIFDKKFVSNSIN